jgi:hypothetical protein
MAHRSIPRKVLLSVLLGAGTMSMAGLIATKVPPCPIRDEVTKVVSTPPALLTQVIDGVGNVNAMPGSVSGAAPGAPPAAGTAPGSWGISFNLMGILFYGMMWWVLVSLLDWVKFGSE